MLSARENWCVEVAKRVAKSVGQKINIRPKLVSARQLNQFRCSEHQHSWLL